MNQGIIFSEGVRPYSWSESSELKLNYGPKGAMLGVLPRAWTLPFALVPASLLANNGRGLLSLDANTISRIRLLGAQSGQIIIRSSIIGESIWERGRYKSVVIPFDEMSFRQNFSQAVFDVLGSADAKQAALVIQSYVPPRSRGEFGNLARISKTRDQWELSTESTDGTTSRLRFNSQRDEAASVKDALELRPRVPPERLFGSVSAWLNNELLRGRSQRLNCEWLTDNKQIYVVQLDEEDEDFWGINPLQVRVAPSHRPSAAKGAFLASADPTALKTWDKLKVLDELWEADATHKPTLFYVSLAAVPKPADHQGLKDLESDFRSLIGPDEIIVRTSVRAGHEKIPNLSRTECVHPAQAAAWCVTKCEEFRKSGGQLDDFAFIAHRFIASRSSAWARAIPGNPVVEIHSLWGLPDALQYCPYDIWEVHLPTEIATEYPEYKSHILIPRADGGWEYLRVKNELGRTLSIGRTDAMDLAIRTAAIANRIGRACHVMWFVGCVDDNGTRYNIPWYWIEAHDADKNLDRSNYNVTVMTDRATLLAFEKQVGSRVRQAIELRPTELELMRDTKFIESVGSAAFKAGVPVILAGSTLAHAYYQLRRQGCTVVTPSEKDHSRVRRNVNFGKLVRDKIPDKIAERQEAEITKRIPPALMKGFLISKLLEEALEVRGADTNNQKIIELGDLYEVVRTLARAEGISLEDVVKNADEKRVKAGGFDEGLVLLQTGILGQDRELMQEGERTVTQVLARKISDDSYEIPFSFFGFMEMNQARSLVFEGLGVRLDVELKTDRIELRLSKEGEQLELPLDLTVGIIPKK